MSRSPRAALALAVLSIVVWLTVIVWLHPGPIVDEVTHYTIIEQLTQGQWPAPGQIPMLPSAHVLIAAVLRITGPSLTAGRAVSAGLTICAVLVFFAAARVRHSDAAGWQTLLMASNPFFLPYGVLVYTESASMLAVVTGLYFHVRRNTRWAALALLAACLIRQSNIAWAALFVVWMMIENTDQPRRSGRSDPPGRLRTLASRLPQTWPYLILMAMFVGAIALRPDLMWTPTADNRAGFNPAQYYLFAFTVAIVLLPLWVERLRRSWSDVLAPQLGRARTCAIVVAVIGALVMLYDNPHQWNDVQTYLRNRFLILLDVSLPVRYAAAALMVVVATALVMQVRQPLQPAMLSAAWIFAMLFLAPHRLVDQRYYIIPLLFIHFFSRYTPRQRRRLCVWQFTLCAAAVAYTIVRGGPESGL